MSLPPIVMGSAVWLLFRNIFVCIGVHCDNNTLFTQHVYKIQSNEKNQGESLEKAIACQTSDIVCGALVNDQGVSSAGLTMVQGVYL